MEGGRKRERERENKQTKSANTIVVFFTSHSSGLEDQLLGIAVAEERPDLEEAKNQLIISNAKMKQELKEIEDRILFRLSSSEGSPVDDIDLIQTLEASKIKSQEIKVGWWMLMYVCWGWGACMCACCLLYTSPSPRDIRESRMPSSA